MSTVKGRKWDPNKMFDLSREEMQAIKERAEMRNAMRKEFQKKIASPYRGVNGYIVSGLTLPGLAAAWHVGPLAGRDGGALPGCHCQGPGPPAPTQSLGHLSRIRAYPSFFTIQNIMCTTRTVGLHSVHAHSTEY